jgi:hypothetical protein
VPLHKRRPAPRPREVAVLAGQTLTQAAGPIADPARELAIPRRQQRPTCHLIRIPCDAALITWALTVALTWALTLKLALLRPSEIVDAPTELTYMTQTLLTAF